MSARNLTRKSGSADWSAQRKSDGCSSRKRGPEARAYGTPMIVSQFAAVSLPVPPSQRSVLGPPSMMSPPLRVEMSSFPPPPEPSLSPPTLSGPEVPITVSSPPVPKVWMLNELLSAVQRLQPRIVSFPPSPED